MNVAISQKYCSHFVILEGTSWKCTFFFCSIVLRLSSYEMLYSDWRISLFVPSFLQHYFKDDTLYSSKKNRILSENVIFHAYLRSWVRTIQETTSPVVSLATQLSSNVQHLTFMSKRTGWRDNLVKHPKLNPNND